MPSPAPTGSQEVEGGGRGDHEATVLENWSCSSIELAKLFKTEHCHEEPVGCTKLTVTNSFQRSEFGRAGEEEFGLPCSQDTSPLPPLMSLCLRWMNVDVLELHLLEDLFPGSREYQVGLVLCQAPFKQLAIGWNQKDAYQICRGLQAGGEHLIPRRRERIAIPNDLGKLQHWGKSNRLMCNICF